LCSNDRGSRSEIRNRSFKLTASDFAPKKSDNLSVLNKNRDICPLNVNKRRKDGKLVVNISHLKPLLCEHGVVNDLFVARAVSPQLKPKVCKFLIDSGASLCVISKHFVYISKVNVIEVDLDLIGVTGTKLKVLGLAEIDFTMEKMQFRHKFVICENPLSIKTTAIIGVDFLKDHQAVLELHKGTMTINNVPIVMHPLKSTTPLFDAELNVVRSVQTSALADNSQDNISNAQLTNKESVNLFKGTQKDASPACHVSMVNSMPQGRPFVADPFSLPGRAAPCAYVGNKAPENITLCYNQVPENLTSIEVVGNGHSYLVGDNNVQLDNLKPAAFSQTGASRKILSWPDEVQGEGSGVVAATCRGRRRPAEEARCSRVPPDIELHSAPSLVENDPPLARRVSHESIETLSVNKNERVAEDYTLPDTAALINYFNMNEIINEEIDSPVFEQYDFICSKDDKVLNTDSNETLLSKFNFSHIKPHILPQLKALIIKYRDVFVDETKSIGRFPGFEAKLVLKPDAQIVRRPFYPVPYALRETLKRNVDTLVGQGVLERVEYSEWASPMLMLLKRVENDGSKTYRTVSDFRLINYAFSDHNNWPIISTQLLINSLTAHPYISVIDFFDAYHSVSLDESSRDFCTITCEYGLFRPTRLLQGLKPAAQIFTKVMDYIFGDLKFNTLFFYLDDVFLFSDSEASHMALLEETFKRLLNNNLKVHPSKAKFFKQEVKFLGFLINGEKGITVDPDKLKIVQSLAPPTCQKHIRQYVGFFSFYRGLLPNFAQDATVLTELTKKNVKWEFSAKHLAAFESLKTKLCNAGYTAFPRYDRKFILSCDAATNQCAAVLSQFNDENIEQPISYFAKTFDKHQRNYGASEREFLCALWACRWARRYIYLQRTTLITDCTAVRFAANANATPRLCRWALELSSYNLELVHRKGSLHINADFLSRASLEGLQGVSINCLGGASDDDYQIIWDRHLILTEQNKDQTVIKIKQSLSGDPMAEEPYYVDHSSGLLYKSKPVGAVGRYTQLYAPEAMRFYLMKTAHDSPLGGHRHGGTTARILSRDFYWPKMKTDCVNFARSCDLCNKYKNNTRDQLAPLGEFNREPTSMMFCHFDSCGPFNVSQNGFKHILVYVCTFSKYAEFVPLRDLTAYTIAKALADIFLRHGCPKSLVSDKSPTLTSKVMQELFTMLNITHQTTTSYHKRADGAAEKCVATLKTTLAIMADKQSTRWDEFLNLVRFSYVNSPHASINESPHFVLYCADIRFPYSCLSDKDNLRQFYNYDTSYRNLMVKRAQFTTQLVTAQLAKAQKSYKQQFDKNAKEKPIEVGSRVYVKNETTKTGTSKAFQPKYTGPFRVIRKDGDYNWLIQEIYGAQKMQICHPDRLKIAVERNNLLKTQEVALKADLNIAREGQNDIETYINSDGEEVKILKKKENKNATGQTAEPDAERQISPPPPEFLLQDLYSSGDEDEENEPSLHAPSDHDSDDENGDAEENNEEQNAELNESGDEEPPPIPPKQSSFGRSIKAPNKLNL